MCQPCYGGMAEALPMLRVSGRGTGMCSPGDQLTERGSRPPESSVPQEMTVPSPLAGGVDGVNAWPLSSQGPGGLHA